jgi:putative peptidoglycan lipid II flippase
VSNARSASKIMVAVAGSRVLGLVREVILNGVLGPGRELDALIAAFRIPNLLRDLFAEGALSTAFVTTFSKKLATESREAAFRLARLVMTAVFLVLTGICLVGIWQADVLVSVLAPGFAQVPGKVELTIDLTRILFPFILFVSLAAVYMGLLNSLGSFGLPASASTVFNVVSISLGLGLGWCFDPALGPRAVYGFAIGTLLGGLAQWLVMVPRAWSLGFRPGWAVDWNDSALRKVGTLMLPAVVGGSAVQVNVLVNTYFASSIADGAVTWLNSAFRLMQLPIGLFGVAIAAVTLPAVSRSAAKSDLGAFRTTMVEGIQFALFLTVPAAVGLALLAGPVITVIFERGAFDEHDTAFTAQALMAYTVGLCGYACIKILAPAFSALDKPGIPLRISLTGIVLNLALNWLFVRHLHFGVTGLALSTSLVALLNAAQLAWALRRELSGLGLVRLCRYGVRLAGALAPMVVVVLGVEFLVSGWVVREWSSWVVLAAAIPAGGGIFVLCAWLLKLPEMEKLAGWLGRAVRSRSA